MRIKENLVAQANSDCDDCRCEDCGAQLRWDSHNDGDLSFQTWVAFCKCKDGRRIWTARPNSFTFTSV